jgi:hypothetical protein
VKLYLETTVPNFLFAGDAPEKKQITEVFFQWLQICPHELCVSPLVEQELNAAAEPKRRQLRAALTTLPLVSLPITTGAEDLAEAYLVAGAIPRRFEDDALHLAIAVCHSVDIIVSWNMRHLVNPRRVTQVNRVNVMQGYRTVRVETPREVMGV